MNRTPRQRVLVAILVLVAALLAVAGGGGIALAQTDTTSTSTSTTETTSTTNSTTTSVPSALGCQQSLERQILVLSRRAAGCEVQSFVPKGGFDLGLCNTKAAAQYMRAALRSPKRCPTCALNRRTDVDGVTKQIEDMFGSVRDKLYCDENTATTRGVNPLECSKQVKLKALTLVKALKDCRTNAARDEFFSKEIDTEAENTCVQAAVVTYKGAVAKLKHCNDCVVDLAGNITSCPCSRDTLADDVAPVIERAHLDVYCGCLSPDLQSINCDDDNPCTLDYCGSLVASSTDPPTAFCNHDKVATDTACGDDPTCNFCSATGECDYKVSISCPGSTTTTSTNTTTTTSTTPCQPGSCDDSDDCTVDTCVATGCSHVTPNELKNQACMFHPGSAPGCCTFVADNLPFKCQRADTPCSGGF